MKSIENKNIIYSNLATDGLHLNNGGVCRFSGNLNMQNVVLSDLNLDAK